MAPVARTVRFLAPVALLALLAPVPRGAVSPAPSAPAVQPQAVSPESGDDLATVRREVRLRKLHLVRPDLIQYPLSVDVFC
jgi:hypothetical protein